MQETAETFRWNDSYSVNIAILDEQHRTLFDIINELDKALRSGEGSVVLEDVLHKLTDYAAAHFELQESLMARHQFPGLTTHRTYHEEFRQKIGEFLTAHRAGRAGVPVAALLFLREWLKGHLLKTDKLYSGFLNACGVR